MQLNQRDLLSCEELELGLVLEGRREGVGSVKDEEIKLSR